MGRRKKPSADRYRATSLAYASGNFHPHNLPPKPPKIKKAKKPKPPKEPKSTPFVKAMALRRRTEVKRTPSESAMQVILEECLKKHKVSFQPEFPVLNYIADFYIKDHRIVIEVDGEYHFFREKQDRKRDAAMKAHNIRVLRFTNHQVMTNPIGVRNELLRAVVGQWAVTLIS
jgi:very-short-patch-repair endonuclease